MTYRQFISARTIVLLGSICAAVSACGDADDAPQAPPLRAVKVATVKSVGEFSDRVFSGTVSSTKETSLSFRVSGTVIAKNVSVSDRITKGDVLARLDPAPYELEVQRAKAALEEARSNARNASSSYERTKRLYEAGNSSREDLDNAKTALNSGQAQQASTAKALELAQLDLSYTKLVSEDACAIASTDLQVGENVQQGQRVLVANCGDGLEVNLGIPERFIAQVNKGAKVSVSFPALPNVTLLGDVDDVGIATTSGGATFPVTVALPEAASAQVKSGLSAQVVFNFRAQNGGAGLIVPSIALGEDQSGRFVYVLEDGGDGTGTVTRTSVEAGALSDDGVEIVSGLTEGARVVTAGVSVLRDGLKVRLPNE
ncbi:MAG: efflux RND transporter periplasmic adaptor subunit [Pseudomonadota bacterium]